jgi:acyl carrier protein phosphodiesterase
MKRASYAAWPCHRPPPALLYSARSNLASPFPLNFLAHLYLAEPTPLGLLGALMGDFVKGPLDGRYPPMLMRALIHHRRIDTFTDAHPMVRASRKRVAPAHRRFAGVLTDMFFDHFLARDWADYADEPMPAFTRRVYDLLDAHHAVLPDRLQRIAPHMRRGDWLGSYAQLASIEAAIDRLGTRLKRGNLLLGGGAELRLQYDAFEADFRTFFPELTAFARSLHPPATLGTPA